MPDLLVVLADRAVRGEDTGHGRVGHCHLLPLHLVGIVGVQPLLRHGVASVILQYEVAVADASPAAQQQAVVQFLQGGGILGHQRAVDHLGHRLADLMVRFVNRHGIIGVLAVHIAHRVAPHTEDVDVVHPHLLADFHVRAVQRTDGHRAVHHELHVAGAAGFLAGRAQLLGNFRRGNQHFRAAHVVVLQEYHLQHLPGPRMLFNQPAQCADHADDLLRAGISGAGFRAEDEHARLHGKVLVVHNPVIQHQDVQRVQHLPLVLVQALRLYVKDEVRIHHRALAALQHHGQALLVAPLDLRELLAEGRVVREGTQLAQPFRILDPVRADALADQVGQQRVAAHQPAAVGNAVGDRGELLRHHLVVVVEGLGLQDVAVQPAHAVHGVAHRHAHVGHVHVVIADDGHPGDAVPVSREEVPQPFAQAAVHFADDLVAPGQQLLHHAHRPLLQGFRHDRVVGVGDRLLDDGGRLVPAQAFLVYQQAHQFGNRHAGMRVVDMDDHLLGQLAHILAEALLVILQDVLQRSAGEEIVLLQAEHLAFIVPVFGIQHLADRLGQLNLFGGLHIAAFTEAVQVQLLRAPGGPHAQRVHHRCVVADHGHVVRHRFHGVVVAGHIVLFAVDLDLFHMAAEVHLAGVLHHGGLPHVAVVQPAVGQFHLLAVHDALAEQSVFIADGAAHGRQVQAAQAVQEACGQAAQAAVAQSGFRFFLQHVLDIDAQFLQGLGIFLGGQQVQHVAVHAAAHQVFDAQVIKALALLLFPGFAAGHHLLHDLVAHGGGHRPVNLLGRGFLDGQSVVPLDFSHNRVFDGFLVKPGRRHIVPPVFRSPGELRKYNTTINYII